MLTELMNEIVRGPEKSAEFGKCLLIYPTCETARPGIFPSQALVVTTAARRLIELSKAGERLNAVVVLGEVDPTLNPDFRAISENLRELCNKWHPKASLTLVSGAQGLDDADIRQALSCYDDPILRFEAGTQKTYAALTGAKPSVFKEVVQNLSKIELERITVAATFVRGDVDNSTESEVRAWVKHLGAIKPATVHVSTLAKIDTKRKLKPITKARLETIANQVADKTGLPVEVKKES